MSAMSGDPTASRGKNKLEPDFFGLCTAEVANLLSLDNGLWHQTSNFSDDLHGSSKNSCVTKERNGTSGSAPSFSNGIGALLPELQNEQLKILLRRSVSCLTQEVDEIVVPVRKLCHIRSILRLKESLLVGDESLSNVTQSEHVNKKQRVLPFSSDLKNVGNLALPVKEPSNNAEKKCIMCHVTKTPQWRPASDGTKSLCNACGLRLRKQRNNELNMGLVAETDITDMEIDDDMLVILKSDTTKVEEVMKAHSSELLAKLEHMEQSLEQLLNRTMQSCRAMTPNEKQQLSKMIQSLPGKYLARVVEIIEHDKQPDSSAELYVDLDNEEKATLWRLYFYVILAQSLPPENISIEKDA